MSDHPHHMAAQREVLNLHDMLNLRLGLQQITNPTQELTDAIQHLDNHIATIIKSLRTNQQDPNNG